MKKFVKFVIAAGIVGTVVAAAVKKAADRKTAYSDSFDDDLYDSSDDDLYEYWDDEKKEGSENEDCPVCDCESCEDCEGCEKSCKENEE